MQRDVFKGNIATADEVSLVSCSLWFGNGRQIRITAVDKDLLCSTNVLSAIQSGLPHHDRNLSNAFAMDGRRLACPMQFRLARTSRSKVA